MDTIAALTTAINMLPHFMQKPIVSFEFNAWVTRDKNQRPIDKWDLWVSIESRNPTSWIVKIDVDLEYRTYRGQWKPLKKWDIVDRYLLPGQGFYFPKNLSDHIGKNRVHKLHELANNMNEKTYNRQRTNLLAFRIGATVKKEVWYSLFKCQNYNIPIMRYFFDFRRLVLIPWFRKSSQFPDD